MYSALHNLFNLRRRLVSAEHYQDWRHGALVSWNQVVAFSTAIFINLRPLPGQSLFYRSIQGLELRLVGFVEMVRRLQVLKL